MIEDINLLDKKLRNANNEERKNILNGVYKQLVVSRNHKQAKGRFREIVESDDKMELVNYVFDALTYMAMDNQATRLFTQYLPGTAYAFFDSDASLDQLKEELKETVENPESLKGLELHVQEGTDGLILDQELLRAIEYPSDYRIFAPNRRLQEPVTESIPAKDLKYTIVNQCIGITNRNAGQRLLKLMTHIHAKFDKDFGVFRCATVFKENYEYHLPERDADYFF